MMLAVSVGTLLSIILLFVFTGPVPQDPAYHAFVDTREFFSIPNFWNVSSNLPFLFVGLWGLVLTLRTSDNPAWSSQRRSLTVMFVGVFLTAFGSSYFHYSPANDTLFWDRLPMTIAFAGLFSAIIGLYVSETAGRKLLLPFLVIGVLSVVYWQWTESRGVGDLRPYAIVQFLPLVATPVILYTRGKRSALTGYMWLMIAFYVAAKIFEHFDAGFYLQPLLSGHSIKHLAAACGPAVLAMGLAGRKRPG